MGIEMDSLNTILKMDNYGLNVNIKMVYCGM